MSDHDHDLRTRVRELEEALLRQDAAHRADMALLSQQVYAVLAVNTALVGALSGQGLLNLEQLRPTVLAKLPDEHQSDNVAMLINSVMTLKPAEPPVSVEPTEEQLRERALARFRVIEGGGQPTDATGQDGSYSGS